MSRLDKLSWADTTYPAKDHPGYVRASATSRAGAERIKSHAETLEDFVLSVLRVSRDGLTDFEIQALAAREGITSLLRPRRATLLARGDIVPSGRKRLSPAGMTVMVWTVRP